MIKPLWKTVWRILKKLNIELPYDLGVPHLGMYLRGLKTYTPAKTCTPMFISSITQNSPKVKTTQMPVD